MNNIFPDFSIIVPLFNRGEYAETLVRSLQQQSETNWEVLLVDDGSSVESLAVWNTYTEKDSRFRFIKRNRNPKGAPTCRNIGVLNSSGKYIIFLDSDDALSFPCSLHERRTALEKNPNLDYIISPTKVFYKLPNDSNAFHNVETEEDDLDRLLGFDIVWQTTSATWCRESIDKIGKWKEGLPSCQDWDYHIRALVLGLKYRRITGGLSFWRISTNSITNQMREKKHLQSLELLLPKIYLLLKQHDQLTPKRKQILARNYAYLAANYYRAQNLIRAEKSLHKWQKIKKSSHLKAKIMMLHVRSYHIPIVGLLLRPLFSIVFGNESIIPRGRRFN